MKGNLFLGYGRGSVGDVVFSRTGGQQVGRARNRKPNNPKTKAQVAHRALFADAVKFYTHGTQALFRFAFEDKQAQESDYNAFMRINAKNGIMLSPGALGDANYPAIGRWVMSKGSLAPLSVSSDTMGENYLFYYHTGVNTTDSEDSMTVAKLTEGLVLSGNFEVGDILTFINIRSTAIRESGELEPVSVGDEPPVWIIAQIVLDPSDSRIVGAILEGKGFDVVKRGAEFCIASHDVYAPEDVAGACAIHSRQTSKGLKVSTQEIVNSAAVISALNYGETNNYRSYIYSAWQAADDAILEGSIANASK